MSFCKSASNTMTSLAFFTVSNTFSAVFKLCLVKYILSSVIQPKYSYNKKKTMLNNGKQFINIFLFWIFLYRKNEWCHISFNSTRYNTLYANAFNEPIARIWLLMSSPFVIELFICDPSSQYNLKNKNPYIPTGIIVYILI